MYVRSLNLQKYASVNEAMDAVVKVRYKDAGTAGTIIQEGDLMRVEFNQHVKSIAPGQSAVFYEGNDVIGGGWITKALNYNA